MKHLAMFCGCLLIAGLSGREDSSKSTSSQEKDTLVQYLRTHWQTPEDYVIEKFKDREIIFIGEMHRVKHDVELIHHLIPGLYKAGVYNLGIEFGGNEYQSSVDSLTTAPAYDEALVRRLMFKWSTLWGYKEYMDIYRKAWELNRSLPSGARKFRVVNLNYCPRWDLVKEEMTREDWNKVWYRGDGDAFMAEVVLKEFVAKGEKALVYSGQHHAFTRYRQPVYDFEKKQLLRLNNTRMGNLVYQKIPGKVFNIYLHFPWSTKEEFNLDLYPVGGMIDQVMNSFKDRRVGFDAAGSPLGSLKDDQTYYSIGYERFCLGDYCDGYVYQMPPKEYIGCTVDTLFITEANLKEAVSLIPNFKARRYFTTPQQFVDDMRRDANWQWRFRNLK